MFADAIHVLEKCLGCCHIATCPVVFGGLCGVVWHEGLGDNYIDDVGSGLLMLSTCVGSLLLLAWRNIDTVIFNDGWSIGRCW